jgi:hypothetical protein
MSEPADLRAALAAAIEARTAAASHLAAAEQAASRAAELLADADAQLADHADLDNRIGDAQAERIAAWASTGGDAPPPSFDDLPHDLAEARSQRDKAVSRAAAARGASVSLDIAKVRAAEALRQAEQCVSDAAVAVLIEEAEPLAAELVETKRRAWDLADRLTGLTQLWAGSPPQPIRPTPAMLDALHLDRSERPILAAPSEAHEAACWRAYHAALIADATAAFAVLPRPPIPSPIQPFVPTPINTSPLNEEEKIRLRSGQRLPRALPPDVQFEPPTPTAA